MARTEDAPTPERPFDPTGLTGASPRVRAQSDGPLSPRRLALRRIAAANRILMEDMVGTEVDVDDLDQVAVALEDLATRFRQDRPRSIYEGMAEAAMSGGDLSMFFDHSPLIGLANPLAPPILIDFGPEVVTGRVRFGSVYEGPPGCVHGGFVAAAFDEILGSAQTYSGSPGMTGRLTVHYRRPTPLHVSLVIEGRYDRTEGRKVYTSGRILHGEEVTAEAEGLFVSVEPARFRELAQAFDRRIDESTGEA